MVNILLLLDIILILTDPAFTKNIVVLGGDSTALGCNSSENFTWRHVSLQGKSTHVYKDHRISYSNSDLGYRMETNLTGFGDRNLLILNVAIALAGVYECDDIDKETILETELIVLEGLPECFANMDEFVGPNNCNIPPDEIQLSCSVTYRGNKSPELKWRKFGDSGDLESTCTPENGSYRKTCSLTVEPDLLLNGSIFICRTTERRSSDEQYNCTTKPIVILHSFSDDESQLTGVSEGDTIECTANSSQLCTYKWVWYEKVDDDLSRTIESKDNVLTARKIGLHRCEAQYQLRNQNCIVYSKFVNVTPSDKYLNQNGKLESDSALSSSERLLLKKLSAAQKSEENGRWTPSIISLLILGVLPYVAFAGYLFIRMRGKGIFDRDRNPICEQGSQTEESSMHRPITTNF